MAAPKQSLAFYREIKEIKFFERKRLNKGVEICMESFIQEKNVFLLYFRPDSVIAKRTRTSLWVAGFFFTRLWPNLEMNYCPAKSRLMLNSECNQHLDGLTRLPLRLALTRSNKSYNDWVKMISLLSDIHNHYILWVWHSYDVIQSLLSKVYDSINYRSISLFQRNSEI